MHNTQILCVNFAICIIVKYDGNISDRSSKLIAFKIIRMDAQIIPSKPITDLLRYIL